MPVVIVLGTGSGGTDNPAENIFNITVQDIMDCVQQNLKETFRASGTPSVLIPYISDVQQQILRRRRWDWTLSGTQRFITERGQSRYWVGSSTYAPDDAVNTGLNLTNIGYVANAGVRSYSTYMSLDPVKNSPLGGSWSTPDGVPVEGAPAQFRTTLAGSGLLELYPAADEGLTYSIVPPAPHSTTATGGALSARTYYLRLTFVDAAGGESEGSTTARQWIAANKLVTVQSPNAPVGAGSAGIGYVSYRVYASTTQGSETLQATVTLDTDWTESASGLTTNGAAVPGTATIEPLNGHLIEFKYHKRHANLEATTDTLIIPDQYADVVCAGATSMAAQYMGDYERSNYWQNIYERGVTQMIRDDNTGPGVTRYILPDPGYSMDRTFVDWES